jgi:hypothetical protein
MIESPQVTQSTMEPKIIPLSKRENGRLKVMKIIRKNSCGQDEIH